MAMTPEEKQDLWDKLDSEGFDYGFRSYSDWSEITDKKFQKLRKAYVEAANTLEKYIKPEEE